LLLFKDNFGFQVEVGLGIDSRSLQTGSDFVEKVLVGAAADVSEALLLLEEGIAGVADHESLALQAIRPTAQIHELESDADEGLRPIMGGNEAIIRQVVGAGAPLLEEQLSGPGRVGDVTIRLKHEHSGLLNLLDAPTGNDHRGEAGGAGLAQMAARTEGEEDEAQ